MNATRAENIAQLYREAAERYGDLPAFASRIEATRWKPVTFRELYKLGLNLAEALINLGVEKKEHVAVLSDNRFEWILADYGIQLCGAVNVPRGTDVTSQEIEYILNHSEAKVVFLENERVLEKVKQNSSSLTHIRTLVLMDPQAREIEGILRLYNLIEKGSLLRKNGEGQAEKRAEGIDPDDLFTLIYTSGTTGKPKGVMLTHANMISQLQRIPIPITPNDRMLSILPIWHIFERVMETYAISRGCCTYYTSIRTLAEDMKNVEPTFMGSAPRLWENVYQKILNNVQTLHPVRRALFHCAMFFSHQFKEAAYFLTFRKLDMSGRNPFLSIIFGLLQALRWIVFLPFYGFFNVSVLERLRLIAGGCLQATISGGGALPVHIDKFFNYIGIPVLEGYGLTETSPILGVRTFENRVIGTVGPIFPDTKIRIVELNSGEILYPNPNRRNGGMGLKGEIHAQGPQVMKGYYKDPETTAKVLKDGWFNTGDLGMITFNNCLKIVGRTKDTIVLTSGENVEPVPIETLLCQSKFIEHAVVVGQDQKFLSALIVPSLEGFKSAGMAANSVAELALSQEAKKQIEKEIKTIISEEAGFKSYERIRYFRLLPQSFSVGEELTAIFKLKRDVITLKYAEIIREIYQSQ